VAQVGEDDQAAKAKVLSALNTTFGVSGSGKQDFNAATPTLLANFLSAKDPLGLSLAAGDKYQQLAKAILAYRDKDQNGVLTSLDDLAKVNGVTPAVVSALKDGFPPRHLPSATLKSSAPRWVASYAIRPSELPSMLWRACWYILPSGSSGFTERRRFWRYFTTS